MPFLDGEALAHGHQKNDGFVNSVDEQRVRHGHHTDDGSARDDDHSCCGGGMGALTRLWGQWIAQEPPSQLSVALSSA